MDFVFPNGSSSSGVDLNAKDATLQTFPDAAFTTVSTTDTTSTTTTATTTTTTTTTEDLGCNSNSSLCLGFDALCQVGFLTKKSLAPSLARFLATIIANGVLDTTAGKVRTKVKSEAFSFHSSARQDDKPT